MIIFIPHRAVYRNLSAVRKTSEIKNIFAGGEKTYVNGSPGPFCGRFNDLCGQSLAFFFHVFHIKFWANVQITLYCTVIISAHLFCGIKVVLSRRTGIYGMKTCTSSKRFLCNKDDPSIPGDLIDHKESVLFPEMIRLRIFFVN